MKTKKLYLVPYAHLDSQWRWTFATTITHYLKDTLHENFKLFEKYPGYCFNFTGALRYKMIREYYPEEYEILKDYIKKEKWKIAGSCLDETDALVPSPESLIRNILYGNIFNKKEFNTESYDYMLPDCFGFPASFPSVIHHCGLKGFSTQKLTWHSAEGIPFSIGMWKGPDGNRLPAAFNPGSYISKLIVRPGTNKKWLKRINDNGQKYDVWKEYRYYGTGDIGGAPMELSVKNAEKSLNAKESIICQDSADKFFRDLSSDEIERLPEYSGDLLLIEHSTGSLTSQAIMKRWNRKNEFLADAAERASVTAAVTGGFKYPYQNLTQAWERVIGSQMHDILPGTCTPDAYTWSNNDEVLALNLFSSVLTHAAETMAENLDTETEGFPLIIFNPLSFKREDLVEAEIPLTGKEVISVYSPDGTMVPAQIISRENDTAHIIFSAETLPLSWTVYDIRKEENRNTHDTEVTARETTDGFILENHTYRVKINRDGFIFSIHDKNQDIEILEGTIHYELQKEKPKYFPAWNMDWKDRKKKPLLLTGTLESITITEQGPVRAAIEITREFNKSLFIQKISLSTGSSGNRINFTEHINWNLKGFSLKTAFPLKSSNPQATYNWQVGKVERNNNHKKKYEVPSQMWFDLTDTSGEHGVSILEDSKYGSDKPDDNTVRLTLLYTPARSWNSLAFHDQTTQDWGNHTIRYSLYSHRGDWREGKSDLQALRFNQPLYPFISEPSPGPLGNNYSFLSLSTDNAVVSALKFAEDKSGAIILRMIELTGEKQKNTHINLPGKITNAIEVNGQEIKTGEIKSTDNRIETELHPFQIRSVAFTTPSAQLPAAPDTVLPLDIPLDTKIFTLNGENRDLAFSYPGELIPERIESGNIFFHVNTNNDCNALLCRGNSLPLPEKFFNRLSMLVSSEEDTWAEFTFPGSDKKPVILFIPSCTGFIGQYDTREWKRKSRWEKRDYLWRIPCTGITPGFVKREEVAFFTTHIHSYGRDLPYQFGYMYRIDLDIPEGADMITLCDNRRVKIFSITLSSKKTSAKNCRHLIDTFDY